MPAGETAPPANFGVGSWIERRARVTPDRPALVGAGRSITYAELARRVRRLAHGLQRLGVRRGDRVAWVGPNHPAFLECLFATGLVGAALAPVNHRLATTEIRAVLADAAATVVVQHASVGPVPLPAGVRGRVAVAGPMDGALDIDALTAESPDGPVQVPAGLDDVCLIPHTSGTTGRPKGPRSSRSCQWQDAAWYHLPVRRPRPFGGHPPPPRETTQGHAGLRHPARPAPRERGPHPSLGA